MGSKKLRDAVHKDIYLDGDELRLIDTAAMQRLRGIRQLGAAFYVYPSAQHTRFEHCIGACWMAKRIVSHIEAGGSFTFPDTEKKALYLAALAHDVTHIPFGHTFEDERRLLEKHDRNQGRYQHFIEQGEVGEVLDSSEPGRLAKSIIAPDMQLPPGKRYLQEIVTGTICADLLDYLKRDNYFCGLSHDFDERIFGYFKIADGRFAVDLQQHGFFRRDALSEISNLLRIRYVLSERVYYHHAKIAAGVMISKAIETAMQLGLREEDLYGLNDDSLIYHLEQQYGRNPGLVGLLGALGSRQLFKRCYMLSRAIGEAKVGELVAAYHMSEGGERVRAETAIAGALGARPHQVAIYCAPEGMALKEAEVPVILATGGPRQLGELNSAELSVLKDQHRALWKFYVFLARPFAGERERAGRICEEIIGLPNELPGEMYGPTE